MLAMNASRCTLLLLDIETITRSFKGGLAASLALQNHYGNSSSELREAHSMRHDAVDDDLYTSDYAKRDDFTTVLDITSADIQSLPAGKQDTFREGRLQAASVRNSSGRLRPLESHTI